ncbi:MAG: SPOR domain-containing protein [Candidatus Omnitrophica bacterium]|nr:SPOR domain-containing protein [Candidatus Omnitrophota bacterium]
MEKETGLQLELFNKAGEIAQEQASGRNDSFFTFVRSYEKSILLIFGFVVTGIICFSLGVEKGKRLVAHNTETRFDVALRPTTAAVSAPVVKPIVSQQEKAKETLLKPAVQKESFSQPAIIKELLLNYTIQIGSYHTKDQAQKEAKALQKKGMLSLVVPKGKYFIVCVGNFNNKSKAQSTLTELKKRYRDCFIRRL